MCSYPGPFDLARCMDGGGICEKYSPDVELSPPMCCFWDGYHTWVPM
jgi:hypothetical protein